MWFGGLATGRPDKWIGWNGEQRQAQLHAVVSMSRLLIRPSVQCGNLASKVLGVSMAALATDFEQQYGYRRQRVFCLSMVMSGSTTVTRRNCHVTM